MRVTCAAIALLLATGGAGVVSATAGDRLDSFRGLVRDAAGAVDPAAAAAIHALVDEEILENLTAGGPFASEAFIQESLDAFAAAWGGARFTVRRLGDALLGVYAGAGLGGAGSVRVFAVRRGGATLAGAFTQEGEPELHDWPPAPGGASQFALTWHGVVVGPGTRALEVQVWRLGADGPVRVWSTADAFPDGLVGSRVGVGRGEITLRYEARYAGRKPGCEGQTELEDVYRPDAPATAPRLVRRRVIDGWHRELHEAVSRFFTALERGDARAVSPLVPDPALRRRLPRTLAADPACDLRAPGASGRVSVAATDERPPARVPWTLRWERHASGWRMVDAAPVLE